MKKSRKTLALLLSALSTLGLLGCGRGNTDRKANPIVGAWFVKDPGAPFAGTITASSYDATGTLTEGPTSATPLEGKRVTLP